MFSNIYLRKRKKYNLFGFKYSQVHRCIFPIYFLGFSLNISIALGFCDKELQFILYIDLQSSDIQSLNTYLVGNRLIYYCTICVLNSSGNLYRAILFFIDFGDELIFSLKTLIYLQNFLSCFSSHSKTLAIILVIILLLHINS